MKPKKSFISSLIISSLFFSLLIFGGGVSYIQNASFNNDGSGIISLTYKAKTSDLKTNNGIIGNLPFTQDKLGEYFNSDVTKIIKSSIYQDKTDPTLTNVSLELSVKNLNRITLAKAFTGVEASWVKRDSGMVMAWLFSPAHQKTNNVDFYQINFTFENDVKSTTGILNGKTVAYYILAEKMNPAGVFYTATVNSDGTSKKPFAEAKTTTDPKTVETKTEENKPSSCGLFGIELPLILLGGLVISKRFRSKKK